VLTRLMPGPPVGSALAKLAQGGRPIANAADLLLSFKLDWFAIKGSASTCSGADAPA
jgi:hypothetical protein